MSTGVEFSADFTLVELHTAHLFAPKGMPGALVTEWCHEVAADFERYAKLLAPPVQSKARRGLTYSRGNLNRAIQGFVEVEGFKRIGIFVTCDVPYAMYVHEGTAAQGNRFIYTTKGWAQKATVDEWVKYKQFRGSEDDRGFWMPIGRTQGRVIGPLSAQRRHGGFGFALRVFGQRANPFLADGYRFLQTEHRSLPRLRKHRYTTLNF